LKEMKELREVRLWDGLTKAFSHAGGGAGREVGVDGRGQGG
jgi:hypothetical protein